MSNIPKEIKEALEKDYPLIPMKDITDEARIIAVRWMECGDKNWIGQKHKLASDIMNYARRASQQTIDDLKAENLRLSNQLADALTEVERLKSENEKLFMENVYYKEELSKNNWPPFNSIV